MNCTIPLQTRGTTVGMCLTAVVYVIVLYALFKARQTSNDFRSSFYNLFIIHSFSEFLLFFCAELFIKPRLFNYFQLFHDDMVFLAQVTPLMLIVLRSAVCLGHLVIAFNRYTVFKYPLTYEEMWSKWTVLLCTFAIWFISFFSTFPMWFFMRQEIRFWTDTSSCIQIFAGSNLVVQRFSMVVLPLLAVVGYVYFYGYALYIVYKSTTEAQILEKRLLLCAIFTSIPSLIEVMRVGFTYYGKATMKTSIARMSAEIWFYEETLAFATQVAVQLIVNTDLRDKVFELFRKPEPKNPVVFLVRVSS